MDASSSKLRQICPQIRSAPNSFEFWDARTALPQVCSLANLRFDPRDVNSTFVPSLWHERAICSALPKKAPMRASSWAKYRLFGQIIIALIPLTATSFFSVKSPRQGIESSAAFSRVRAAKNILVGNLSENAKRGFSFGRFCCYRLILDYQVPVGIGRDATGTEAP